MILPDKKRMGKRFLKQKETYKKHALVQKLVSKVLGEKLSTCMPETGSLMEIGCGVGFLTNFILQNIRVGKYYVNDITPEIRTDIAEIFDTHAFKNFEFVAGDAEKIQFPQDLQAIISSSTFQWFHDLPGFFKKAHHALPMDGILAFSTFGPGNFSEVRQVTGHGLRYFTLSQLKTFLYPGFTILHAEEWMQKIWFDTPEQVLRHIQATGVNSTNDRFFGKVDMQNFIRSYERLFKENDQVGLNYHPIIVIVKKQKSANSSQVVSNGY